MMESFGRKALKAETVAALVEMELAEGRSERFASLDSIVGGLLVRSLHGERIVTMTEDELHINYVRINGLSQEQRTYLDDTFDIERQQSKGAWFIPEKVNISGGMTNISWYFNEFPHFAHSVSSQEGGRVLLKSSPDAIFLWAVLEPLFQELAYPFELRGELTGTLSTEDHIAAWEDVDDLFQMLGFSAAEELTVFRHGGGWLKLRKAAAQLEAKQRLLRALAREADPAMGTRYRVCSILPLIEQYYKKAKSDGRAKRKQALTKAVQPILTGFFGGDWLSFLDYLGEEPHPEEQIVTALPKTPLRVGGTSRVAEIAAMQGIPAEEVQRIAAALWQQSGGTSPVEERVAILKRYWLAFDEIHARQRSGMRPLWGLVEEFGSITFERNVDSPHQPGLYHEMLPQEINRDIERLWGTVMLTKWPDRIVTEPFPHQFMAQTFGSALSFWQSCGLTAWFLCEGPYSRTDMSGLAHHERRELAELKEMGTPIDERLFEELIKTEARLGPEERIEDKSSSTDIGYGITITTSLSVGSRRKGFESLRDIITRHRRAWAEQYLDRYLRTRWEHEIGDAARAFNLLLSEKGGKAPTLKQFARAATLPTNHWFGGDVSALYGAIGEKSPAQPQRRVIMPADKASFVRLVMKSLPSVPFELYDGKMADKDAQESYLKELAELSIKYVQLEEALGRSPEMKEIGEKFSYRSKAISSDEAEAWPIYKEAVERAKNAVSKSSITNGVRPNVLPRDQSCVATSYETKQLPQPATQSHDFTPDKSEMPTVSTEPRQQSEQSEKKRSWLDRLLGKQ